MGKKVIKIWWEFHKNYDENSDKGYFFEVDVEYPKTFINPHKDLPILPKKERKS